MPAVVDSSEAGHHLFFLTGYFAVTLRRDGQISGKTRMSVFDPQGNVVKPLVRRLRWISTTDFLGWEHVHDR